MGKDCKIDENTTVGYMPSRRIKDLTLIIRDSSVIRAGTIIYLGSRIGSGLETGHNVIIREENVIGNNFKIWSNSVVDYGCNIGNNVKVHNGCYIAQFTTIEDDVFWPQVLWYPTKTLPMWLCMEFRQEYISG